MPLSAQGQHEKNQTSRQRVCNSRYSETAFEACVTSVTCPQMWPEVNRQTYNKWQILGWNASNHIKMSVIIIIISVGFQMEQDGISPKAMKFYEVERLHFLMQIK